MTPAKEVVPKTNEAAKDDEQEPQWKQPFDENDTRKQILVLETAAKSALSCFQHMLSILKSQTEAVRICSLWIERIETFLDLQKRDRVLVGFRGVTGAGKSTLINALIVKDLLPMTTGQACTAVPVEVSYNYDDDPNKLFRAEVEFAGFEEWKAELDILFEDVEAYFHIRRQDNEEDLDRKERIEDALSKLKYVYPDLNAIQNLRTTTVAKLLKHKNVQKVLGSIRQIHRSSQPKLSAAIRKYIATQQDSDRKFDFWPLVKRVKVFVKHDLLESGIVLVDLPGSMDTNTARGAVAADYQKHLAVTCMVVDARRGIDDGNAHDMIEELLKHELKMNGSYNSDHLCFILSQCDRDYDVPYYIRQNKEVNTILKDVLKFCRETYISFRERSNSLAELEKSHKEHTDEMQELKAQIEAIHSAGLQASSVSNLKRKRYQCDENTITDAPHSAERQTTNKADLQIKLSKLERIVATEAEQQLKLQKRIKDLRSALNHGHSKMTHACNSHKKKNQVAAVRKDFEKTQTEMGGASKKPLPVFSVASATFILYKYRIAKARRCGFPSIQDTEIPQLRDWLFSFTFGQREKDARIILDEAESLITSMKPWVEDTRGDLKISAQERLELEPIFELKTKDLGMALSKLTSRVADSTKALVEAKIFSQMAEAEQIAADNSSTNLVHGFGKVAWNTYRSIHQRRGQWLDPKKGKDYNWNRQIAKGYTEVLVTDWNDVFFRAKGISQDIAFYSDEGQQLIADFAAAATTIDNYPDINMDLDILKQQIIRTSRILSYKTGTILEKLKGDAKSFDRNIAAPVIREFLKPLYAKCGQARGCGHFQKNKNTHVSYMKEHGVACYQKVSKAIREAIQEILDGLPGKLLSSQLEIMTQIENEIQVFLEQITSSGSRTTQRRVISQPKVKLQKALKADIDGLYKAWKEKAVFEPEEDKIFSELDFEEDDNYRIRSSGDGDGDGDYTYSGSDDEDDEE